MKPVRKAVLPVAGLGTRVLPGTKTTVADLFAARWAGHGVTDAEQAKVVVVVGGGVGLQEIGAVCHVRGNDKAENVLIEARGALGVADVQDRMVQSLNFEGHSSIVSHSEAMGSEFRWLFLSGSGLMHG